VSGRFLWVRHLLVAAPSFGFHRGGEWDDCRGGSQRGFFGRGGRRSASVVAMIVIIVVVGLAVS